MFRRSKSAEPVTTVPAKAGGKGRATPTRREAEAAAKARAKAPLDKKAAARQARAARAGRPVPGRAGSNLSSAEIRRRMKEGDEQFLPARDKGPVRRFVRDWVDSRLCMAELLLPLLLLVMVTGAIDAGLSSGLWGATILLVALDTVLVVVRVRREVNRRFPDQVTKGAAGYAVLRSLQLRFIRLPKAQVKIGAKLPERYV